VTVSSAAPLALAAPAAALRAWPWQQLPVHSPLGLRAAYKSARLGLGAGEDSRPRVRALVRVLYEADDALLVGSGTQALTLALRAAAPAQDGRGPGGPGGPGIVALPAYSCYDVATAAVAANARIALYDVNPGTLAPDMASLAAALALGARAVVVAPLYGMPVDWEAIEQCARTFGAVAVEDAAQGHGATWRERPLGSLGRVSVLSFGRGKGWTAGQGGALLVRDGARLPDSAPRDSDGVDEVTVAVTALAQSALARPGVYGFPAALPWLHLGETRYREPQDPRAMSRTAAALLERMLPAATHEAEQRRANATALLARLDSRPEVRTITPVAEGSPGFLRLPLLVARGLDGCADAALARRVGVARGYPTTLAALAPVAQRLVHKGHWPGAEQLARELVTLPTHSWVSEADREGLVGLLERRE
jgi:dTDP-4-amino-4,6-dideoxygalactose transaminase